MHVKPIKMRWATGGDNYCYLLSTQDKKSSWIFDPAETLEVLPHLDNFEIKSVKAIVNTHHHYDHSDGNLNMINEFKMSGNMNVVNIVAGSKTSPGATEIPKDMHRYQLGDLDITCIRTPCHTQDSICYYVKDQGTNEQCIFTGDTLFTAGCGRFFEGNGKEMDDALNRRILQGVGEPNWNLTKVYPGHEYTKSNCKFVRKAVYRSISENKAFDVLDDYANNHQVTTGAFTLQDEFNFNPFMRLDDPLVRKAVGDLDNSWPKEAVIDQLRKMKNSM